MTKVLTEDEVSQLLTAINAGQDEISQVLTPINAERDELERMIDELTVTINSGGDPLEEYKSFGIEEFTEYLTKRKFKREKPYGIFDKDVSICRFSGTGQDENLLEDIKRKNQEQGQGNITIPNTNIMLINYSVCPKCKTTYSFKEISDYYKNPKPDALYSSRAHQFRTDTRVFCSNCHSYFLPALIIADGTPKNEVQFLCRSQTIDAVEKYFSKQGKKVLTKNKGNIVRKEKLRAIKNDVYIKSLSEKPTLITNIVQYTPFNLIMNLIDGTNVDKGDLMFDEWKPAG